MALRYGFFNSVKGDRKYNAEDFSRFFDGILTDGIVPGIGNGFKVTAKAGTTVTIDTGRAWLKTKWAWNDTPYDIDLGAPPSANKRYDEVCLTVDTSDAVRAVFFEVVHGAEAATPARPALVNNEAKRQYSIASVIRYSGTSVVNAGDITLSVMDPKNPDSLPQAGFSMPTKLAFGRAAINGGFFQLPTAMQSYDVPLSKDMLYGNIGYTTTHGGGFLIQESGFYRYTALVLWTGGPAPWTGYMTIKYWRGGSATNVAVTITYKPDGEDMTNSISDIVYLKAGDMLTMSVRSNKNGTYTWGDQTTQGTRLTIEKVQ